MKSGSFTGSIIAEASLKVDVAPKEKLAASFVDQVAPIAWRIWGLQYILIKRHIVGLSRSILTKW